MRLLSYDRGGARRLAAWVGDVVIDLPDAVGHPSFPATLETLVARNGGTTMDAARAALENPGAVQDFAVRRPHMLTPLALAEDRAVEMLAPRASIPAPPRGLELVCRPELACIVGRAALALEPSEAGAALFGYTLVNAWYLREQGTTELASIGTAVGPCVVTADDFDPSGCPFVLDVDGRAMAEVRLSTQAPARFARTIARASRKGGVQPGEIYGLSPFPEPTRIAIARRRRSETVVAVEVPGVGRLENRVSLSR
jgi:hypothetical protein